jgi:hypothetical protein
MEIDKTALKPIYVTQHPNQQLLLYQGKMQLTCSNLGENNTDSGKGCVKLHWPSGAKIKYFFEADDSGSLNIFREKNHQERLELSEINTSTEVFSAHFNGVDGSSFGNLIQPAKIGNPSQISYLIFHIANFHDYLGTWIQDSSTGWAGRISLVSSQWKIKIDSLSPKIRKKLFTSLRIDGGFAITNVGQIERIDKDHFSIEEVEDCLKALWYFLSFLRGAWVGLILPIGFDRNHNKVWEKWSSQKISPFSDSMSWFSRQDTRRDLDVMFSRFMDYWSDSSFQETLMLVIHWYVESNLQSGAVEGSILMAQAAYELLFEVKSNSNSNSTRISAEKKLKEILLWAKLPIKGTEIPSDEGKLSSLMSFVSATENQVFNIPQAITRVRNKLTHPKSKNTQLIIYSNSLRIETWQVSLWYLELLILYLLDYQGLYRNRLRFIYEGDYDEVPWMKNL